MQPTTYYAPEEIKQGSGMRIWWDVRFDFTGYIEPEPVPPGLLAEMDRALEQRREVYKWKYASMRRQLNITA